MKKIDLSTMSRSELEAFALQEASRAIALEQKLSAYEEQMRAMVQQKYGRKSEQTVVDENQLSIFNEAEETGKPEQKEPAYCQVEKPKKKKSKGSKEAKLAKLPKITTEYILNDEEKICPVCNEPLTEMKTVVRKEVEIIPPKIVCHEHIQHIYSCRHCDKNGEKGTIISAEAPKPILPGSVLSPSLLSYIICQKYDQRLPLYQQEKNFKAWDLQISRQVMANWIVRCAQLYGEVLVKRMKEHLLDSEYIHADETPIQVLHEEGKAATSKSYMWVLATNYTETPILIYHYAASRSGDVAADYLHGYKNCLQCDGYDGYNKVEGITRIGCLAHVRRKFETASKAAKGAVDERVTEGIARCDALFHLDASIKEEYTKLREAGDTKWQEKLLAMKEEKVRKPMEEFFAWAEKEHEGMQIRSGLLWKALSYAVHEKAYMMNYFADGRIEISNNPAERAIRPFAIGRKNWLFSNTANGAKASEVWYSLVLTAEANDLNPFTYLSHIFETLRGKKAEDLTTEEIDQLLPWSKELPDSCKSKI